MKGFIKVLLILLGLVALGVGGIMAYASWTFRGYGEAERVQPAVWELAARIREVNARHQPLPTSLDEMISSLSNEQRQNIQARPWRWNPGTDPVFAIKINEHWGFTIAASGDPQWMRSPKTDFPK